MVAMHTNGCDRSPLSIDGDRILFAEEGRERRMRRNITAVWTGFLTLREWLLVVRIEFANIVKQPCVVSSFLVEVPYLLGKRTSVICYHEQVFGKKVTNATYISRVGKEVQRQSPNTGICCF